MGTTVLAILALVVILSLDRAMPYVTITPQCAFLAVGLLALRLRPRVLFFWVLIYSATSIFMIYQDRGNWNQNSHEIRFLIRIVGVLVSNGMALGLSTYRTRLEDSYRQVLDVFQKIPSALIVSDSSGNIVSVNEETAHLCGLTPAEMIGDSYFKFFGIGRTKGDSIKKYLDMVQSSLVASQSQEIQIISSGIYIPGNLAALRLSSPGEEKWILTTLLNSKTDPNL